MPGTATRRGRDVFVTSTLSPGVRLHLLRSQRFTTSFCRVVLQRDLGGEAAATAVLGQVLQSATEHHPTREALAHRLADLYGAALHVGVGKFGDRQTLAATLEWPTDHVPRKKGLLAEGLGLLREVWSEPKRGPGSEGAAFDPEIVHTEQINHVRALRGLQNDKGRYALRRCLAEVCAGEPFGLDAEGREEDVAAATPEALASLHGRLLATAPVDVYLVADLTLREAKKLVATHLLWSGRASRPRRVPPIVSVHPARGRPKRLVEQDQITQGKLVFGLRAAIRPDAAAAHAMDVLTGVLGGGAYARLFKVVREEHGLCYYASAGWHRPKGVLAIQTGIDPDNERRTRRLVMRLVRETAEGKLEPTALEGFLRDIAHRVAALRDSPLAMVGWFQQRLALGLNPSPRVYLADLRGVRPADVRRAGRKLALDTTFYLRPAVDAGSAGRSTRR